MRIVAGDAGLDRIVAHRIYLRKSRGTRRVVSVAERTIATVARSGWFVFRGIFNVSGSGPVAYLARHRSMLALIMHRDLVGMTRLALFVAGVDQRPGSVQINCRGAIVSQSTESFGDEIVAGSYQETTQDEK